jgi:enoyl-CoA hydratase/carnithine racemase
MAADRPPFSALSIRKQEGVAWIAIDAPPINLLDLRLTFELDMAVRQLEQDDDVRVLVFESRVPDYFLSHADLAALRQARDAGAFANVDELGFYQRLLERLRTMPKVTMAKLDGRARGGGAEFVLALDMAFATPRARFAQMEALVGINPGGGGAQYLVRKAGRSRTLELCLGGSDVGGDDAVRYGYVNRLLPAETLDAYVDSLALRIASLPAAVIAGNKTDVLAAEPDLPSALLASSKVFAELVGAPEFDRRTEAFLAAGGQTADGEREDLARLAPLLAARASA